MFCCPRCSHLSTILNNIIEPELGVTILFNIVDSYEQCGQQNIVQSCFHQYCHNLTIYLYNVDYLSSQQLWYYNTFCLWKHHVNLLLQSFRSVSFPDCVYPNPHCQLSLWEETGAPGENPQLSAKRWLTLFTWVRSKNPVPTNSKLTSRIWSPTRIPRSYPGDFTSHTKIPVAFPPKIFSPSPCTVWSVVIYRGSLGASTSFVGTLKYIHIMELDKKKLY
jgi:hypothetical protein